MATTNESPVYFSQIILSKISQVAWIYNKYKNDTDHDYDIHMPAQAQSGFSEHLYENWSTILFSVLSTAIMGFVIQCITSNDFLLIRQVSNKVRSCLPRNLISPYLDAVASVKHAAQTVEVSSKDVAKSFSRIDQSFHEINQSVKQIDSTAYHLGAGVVESADAIASPFRLIERSISSAFTKPQLRYSTIFFTLATTIYVASFTESPVARVALFVGAMATLSGLGITITHDLIEPLKSIARYLYNKITGKASAQAGSTNLFVEAYTTVVKIFSGVLGFSYQESELNNKAVSAVRSALLLVKDSTTAIKAIFKMLSEGFMHLYYSITGKVLRTPMIDQRIYDSLSWIKDVRALIQLDLNPKLSILLDPKKSRELLDLEKKGNELAEQLMRRTVDNSNFREFFDTLNCLRSFNNYTKSVEMGRTRNRPVAVAVLGKLAGVGKSIMVPMLFNDVTQYLKNQGHEAPIYDPNDVYAKNTMSDYDEGYVNQSFVVLDDYGQYNEQATTAKTLQWIVNAVNDAPFCVNMAFESKGMVFFTSSFLAITSNQSPIENNKSITNMDAIISRFDIMIDVQLKPEFVQSNTRGPSVDTYSRDVWVITDITTKKVIQYKDVVLRLAEAYLKYRVKQSRVADFLFNENDANNWATKNLGVAKAQGAIVATASIIPPILDETRDVLPHIAQFLDSKDLVNFSLSCSYFLTAACARLRSRAELYYKLCELDEYRDFGVRLEDCSSEPCLDSEVGCCEKSPPCLDPFCSSMIQAIVTMREPRMSKRWIVPFDTTIPPYVLVKLRYPTLLKLSLVSKSLRITVLNYLALEFSNLLCNYIPYVRIGDHTYGTYNIKKARQNQEKDVAYNAKRWHNIKSVDTVIKNLHTWARPKEWQFSCPEHGYQFFQCKAERCPPVFEAQCIQAYCCGLIGHASQAKKLHTMEDEDVIKAIQQTVDDAISPYTKEQLRCNAECLVEAASRMQAKRYPHYRDLTARAQALPEDYIPLTLQIVRNELPTYLLNNARLAFVDIYANRKYSNWKSFDIVSNDGPTNMAIFIFHALETYPIEEAPSDQILVSAFGVEYSGDSTLSGLLVENLKKIATDKREKTVAADILDRFISAGGYITPLGDVCLDPHYDQADFSKREALISEVTQYFYTLYDIQEYQDRFLIGTPDLSRVNPALLQAILGRLASQEADKTKASVIADRVAAIHGQKKAKGCLHNTTKERVIDRLSLVKDLDREFGVQLPTGTHAWVSKFLNQMCYRSRISAALSRADQRLPKLDHTVKATVPTWDDVRNDFFSYTGAILNIVNCGHFDHDQRILFLWELNKEDIRKGFERELEGALASAGTLFRSIFTTFDAAIFKMEDFVHNAFSFKLGGCRSFEEMVDDLTSFKPDDQVAHNPLMGLVEFGIVVASIFGTYKLLKHLYNSQSNDITDIKEIEKAQSELPEQYTESGVITPVMTSPRLVAFAQSKDANADDIVINKVVPNLYYYKVVSKSLKTSYASQLLFVDQTTAMTVLHTLNYVSKAPDACLRIASSATLVGGNALYEIPFSKLNIQVLDGQDVAFITFPTNIFKSHKTLTHLFSEGSETLSALRNGLVLVTKDKDNHVVKQVSSYSRPSRISYTDANNTAWVNTDMFETDLHTDDGTCGGIYVTYTPDQRHKLVGFHVCANRNSAFGKSITQDIIKLVHVKAQSKKLPIAVERFKQKYCEDGDPKVQFENHEVIGKVRSDYQVWSPGDTKIIRSPLYNKIWTSKVAPSCMKFMPDGTPSYEMVLKKIDVPERLAPEAYQQMLSEAYDHLFATTPLLVPADIVPLHLVINGSSVYNLERMNIQSAFGFKENSEIKSLASIKKGKLSFFNLVEGQYYPTAKMSQILFEKIQDIIEGREPEVVFETLHKAETRPLEKLYPRAIFGSPTWLTMLSRAFFGSVFGNFMAHHNDGPIKIGINPHSLDWDILAKNLNIDLGWVPFAGDISNNDNTISEFTDAQVANFYLKFMKTYRPSAPINYDLGNGLSVSLTAEQVGVMQEWLAKRAYKHIRIYGDVAVLYNSKNASGRGETTVVNSMCSYTTVLSYIKTKLNQLGLSDTWMDVLRVVRIATFGDDNIFSVRPDIAKHCSLADLAQFFKEAVNMDYTDASKSSPDLWPKSHTWATASFLKRNFVQDKLGYFEGALDVNSIHESINYVKRTVGPHKALSTNIEVALREMFHHGEQPYNDFLALIRTKLLEFGLAKTVTFPAYSYDTLLGNYISGGLILSMFPRDVVDPAKAQSGVGTLSEIDPIINEVDELTAFADAVPCIENQRPLWSSILTRTDPYPSQNIGSIAERPVVENLVWLSTAAPGTLLAQYNFPETILNGNPYIASTLTRSGKFRAAVSVEFKPTTNLFSSGTLVACFRPRQSYVLNTAATGRFLLTQAFCFEHVIISATDGVNVCFNIPYLSPDDYCVTGDTQPGAIGTVEVYVLDQLNNTETTTTSISLSVCMKFLDLQIAAPLDPAYAQSGRVQEIKSASKGLLSTGLAHVAKIVPMLFSIPQVGPVLSVSGPVFSALSRLAASHGYDKPTVIETIQKMKPYHVENLMLGAGADLSEKLALSPINAVSNDTRIFADPKDYSLFDNYKKLPGFVGKLRFTATTYAIGGRIMYWFCTPTLSNVSTVTSGHQIQIKNHLTPTSALASLFQVWTGSLDYMIYVNCPKTVAGKIRVVWYPQVPPSAVTDGAPNIISTVFDFSGVTRFKFKVPYLQQNAWSQCIPYDAYVVTSGSTPRDTTNSYSGCVALYLENALSYTGDPANSPVDINVFAAGGCDLRFNVFRGLPASYAYNSNRMEALDGNAQIQYATGVVDDAKAQSASLREDFSSDFEPLTKSSTTVIRSGILYGEEISNFHTIAHRVEQYTAYQISNSQLAMFTNALHTSSAEVYKSQLKRLNYQSDTRGVATYTVYHQFIDRLFLLKRGSDRWKIRSLGDIGNTSTSMAFMNLPSEPAISWNYSGSNENTMDLAQTSDNPFPVVVAQLDTYSGNPISGNVQAGAIELPINQTSDLEVPYNNTVPYYFTRTSPWVTDTQFEYSLSQYVPEPRPSTNSFLASYSISDDTSWGHPTVPDCLQINCSNYQQLDGLKSPRPIRTEGKEEVPPPPYSAKHARHKK